MLLVNGNPLNMEDKDNPYVKEFFEWKENFIKTHKFPLRLRTNLLPQVNITGDREPDRFRFVPWIANAHKDGIPVQWRYMDTPNNHRVKGESVGAVLTIQSKDMDKAFFYMTKCPLLDRGHMWLENKALEAKSRLDAKSRMVDVNWMLLSEASELSKDESRVRDVALALGLKKADNKDAFSLPEIKDAILRTVERGEANNDPMVNVDAFLEIVGTPAIMRRKALIQKAEDQNYISYDNNRFMVNIHISGEIRDYVKINPREWDRKEEVLLNTLIEDDARRSTLESLMGEKLVEEEEMTVPAVMNMQWNKLKAKCEECGIETVGRKKEVLQKELLEHLKLV